MIGALLVLTFNTGLIDAVSYIVLGRVFVANITGSRRRMNSGLSEFCRTGRKPSRSSSYQNVAVF